MKNQIKFFLLFYFFTLFTISAQKPGDTKVLSSNTSIKGRIELQKEQKVQRRERKMDRRHAREARRKNTTVTLVKHEPARKKTKREKKHKAKPVEAPSKD